MSIKMARNELCVTIPSYFKCPISMEVMKSPVSLSTGVTYDRSSIQRWLESGHTTCPATMQPLSSPSFVPNLTLLRLMNLWPTLSPPSPRYNGSDKDFLASFRKLVRKAETCDEYCRVLAKSEELLQSLKKGYDQAKKSDDFCRVLGNSKDVLDTIVRLIVMFDHVNGKIESLELMFVLLDLVASDVGVHKKLIGYLSKFVFVLRSGRSMESKIAIARILHKIVDNDGETKLVIMETPSLIQEIYNLVKCDNNASIEAGLSFLVAVAGNSRSLKKDLLRLGMVKRLGEVMREGRTQENVVVESVMEALEMIAMSSEGRKAICEDEKCVEEMVRRLMKGSPKATEHGVTVLWSVCYKFKDDKGLEIVRKNSGVGKCLLLLQSNCTPLVKQMCGDLVRVLRGSTKSCASYVSKTTHVMPC